MSVDQLDQSTFAQEWIDWHHQHEKALADPHGFLAVTGLHWLTSEPTRFDDAPGAWSTSDDGVRVDLADGETLVICGTTVRDTYNFGVIPERGGRNASFGNALVEVAKRGGYDIVRPRHPEHRLVQNYRGTPAFTPDLQWVASGRYIPFDSPRSITVGAAVEGLQHVYDAPGQIQFEIQGSTYHLTAFGGAKGSLMVLFTDATSGVTTYGANRVLVVDAPDEQGRVTLDFNRATNLPCAYTDLATCPLPPAENKLPIAISAGEKIPYERLDA
jgi:uncharacterized protein (DUF1684 family)